MPMLRHVRREYLTFVTYSVVRYSARSDTLYAYQLDANYRYVFPRNLMLFGSRFTFESPLSEPRRERVKRTAIVKKWWMGRGKYLDYSWRIDLGRSS